MGDCFKRPAEGGGVRRNGTKSGAASAGVPSMRTPRQPAQQKLTICIGNLNHLFSGPSNIAEPGSCQFPFLLDEISVLLRLAWAAQRSQARDSSSVGLRWQPVRALKPFGIDRIASLARAAGRGWAGPYG
jgi:hypothetical protein